MSRQTELSPCLEVLGAQLDKDVINLLLPHCWTFFEQKVGLETCWCCFQLSYPAILHGRICLKAWPAKQGVRQPFCSSLMPILSTTTAPQRGMCFNIWAILVARCWHLIWPCVFQIISSSQRFKDIAGSRAWMVLCALPSTLEGSQPQGGSSLQEKEATVSKSSPLKETAPEFINGVNGAIRRKKNGKERIW